MNGRPKVAENGNGSGWVDKIGLEAEKSGSRAKKEDGLSEKEGIRELQ